MKIDIITFHFVQNYGAVLQAWALQEKLEQMNNEVLLLIIDPTIIPQDIRCGTVC